MPAPITKSGRVFLAVLLITLGVFGGLVTALTVTLRGQLRAGALRREALAIDGVAQLQLSSAGLPFVAMGAADAMADLFAALLESSRLQGVLALQIFDRNGRLQHALPPADGTAAVVPWWSPSLGEPSTRFTPQGSSASLFGRAARDDGPTLPLLEVVVPLRRGEKSTPVLGTARYWLDGTGIAAEFARMDRALFAQAGMAFAGGAIVVVLVLSWAYARLTAANRQLAAQSADLVRANQELAFAAKTGAIGAISAHLIHGLKNPLSGLEGFVQEHAPAGGPPTGEAWQMAVDTTRRLRELVNEAVGVLREESSSPAGYRVPVREIIAGAVRRSEPAARAAGVVIEVDAPADLELSARPANLAGLVLANLVANAIEASPRGSRVQITARTDGEMAEFSVLDEGVGLPPEIQANLFQPIRSTKPGGGGIGLAISRQIARHAGGELQLAARNGKRTEFRLRVPHAIL